MNVAIILTVSEYLKPENNLPASKKDGDIIYTLLEGTSKYENILFLNKNEKSSLIKEKLSNFFIQNKINEIDELFFYYSGHGEFSNDEFYYLLSDYDYKKKNQTTLQNNEIDDLIKTLSPNLVVKVIDACQSGTTYIKEQDVISKYFNESKKSFNKCYFLNSSLSNQYSYQDDNLSFFTHSFIQSIKEHPSNEIRYKDVIDFILDDFHDNNIQTPFFVLQAELTEKFCSISDDLRKNISEIILTKNSILNKTETPKSIYEIVKEDSENYATKEGAINSIDFCKSKFDNLILDTEINNLFELNILFIENQNTITGVKTIGRWLKENKNDFFAKPYYTEVYDDDGNDRLIIDGYTQLIDIPYNAISIEIKSKFPNIKSYQSNIALLVSKKQLTFFYNILDYKEIDWDNKELITENLKWTYANSKITQNDSIQNRINTLWSFVNDKIKTDINIQFGLQNEEDNEDKKEIENSKSA